MGMLFAGVSSVSVAYPSQTKVEPSANPAYPKQIHGAYWSLIPSISSREASSSAMLRPLAVLLEAAAAKAVKPVALLLVEGAIFVLVGSVARLKGSYYD
jgi:hypothetical protein